MAFAKLKHILSNYSEIEIFEKINKATDYFKALISENLIKNDTGNITLTLSVIYFDSDTLEEIIRLTDSKTLMFERKNESYFGFNYNILDDKNQPINSDQRLMELVFLIIVFKFQSYQYNRKDGRFPQFKFELSSSADYTFNDLIKNELDKTISSIVYLLYISELIAFEDIEDELYYLKTEGKNKGAEWKYISGNLAVVEHEDPKITPINLLNQSDIQKIFLHDLLFKDKVDKIVRNLVYDDGSIVSYNTSLAQIYYKRFAPSMGFQGFNVLNIHFGNLDWNFKRTENNFRSLTKPYARYGIDIILSSVPSEEKKLENEDIKYLVVESNPSLLKSYDNFYNYLQKFNTPSLHPYFYGFYDILSPMFSYHYGENANEKLMELQKLLEKKETIGGVEYSLIDFSYYAQYDKALTGNKNASFNPNFSNKVDNYYKYVVVFLQPVLAHYIKEKFAEMIIYLIEGQINQYDRNEILELNIKEHYAILIDDFLKRILHPSNFLENGYMIYTEYEFFNEKSGYVYFNKPVIFNLAHISSNGDYLLILKDSNNEKIQIINLFRSFNASDFKIFNNLYNLDAELVISDWKYKLIIEINGNIYSNFKSILKHLSDFYKEIHIKNKYFEIEKMTNQTSDIRDWIFEFSNDGIYGNIFHLGKDALFLKSFIIENGGIINVNATSPIIINNIDDFIKHIESVGVIPKDELRKKIGYLKLQDKKEILKDETQDEQKVEKLDFKINELDNDIDTKKPEYDLSDIALFLVGRTTYNSKTYKAFMLKFGGDVYTSIEKALRERKTFYLISNNKNPKKPSKLFLEYQDKIGKNIVSEKEFHTILVQNYNFANEQILEHLLLDSAASVD